MCYLQIIIYSFYWSIFLCNVLWPSSFKWLLICFVFSTPTQRCTLNYCTSPACLTTITPWKMQKQVSMSEKRYLPTVLESNNFTIKYLFFSKAVLKKLNYIKICLYLKLNRLRRDRTLCKLRKKSSYNGWSIYDLIIFTLNFAEKSLLLNKKGVNPKAQQPQKQNFFHWYVCSEMGTRAP